MYFNRLDILDAYYLFFSENHSGQCSDLYRRLSKLLSYYKPAPGLRLETANENVYAIYENALEQYYLSTDCTDLDCKHCGGDQ